MARSERVEVEGPLGLITRWKYALWWERMVVLDASRARVRDYRDDVAQISSGAVSQHASRERTGCN